MKIYVDTPLDKELKQILVEATRGDELFFKDELPDDEAKLKALLSANIIFGNPRPVEWMEKAANLKWVQLYSTGFDYYANINIPAIVTNMQDYYSQPCAETIIAGILALYRGIDKFSTLKEKKVWVGHASRKELNTLYQKRVIILGKGRIANHLAKSLSGFECKVQFFARQNTAADMHTISQLKSHLPEADIVIGCLPGTDETHGLITEELIESLSAQCIFCNVGRGNLVANEHSLIDALKNYKIGGAVLDVTMHEPLPQDHPLWHCPNTILTQHSGGGSISEYAGIVNFFLENYGLFKKHQQLKNVINLKRGY
jgi:glyoxylate/hydroxypyruvate reductase